MRSQSIYVSPLSGRDYVLTRRRGNVAFGASSAGEPGSANGSYVGTVPRAWARPV